MTRSLKWLRVFLRPDTKKPVMRGMTGRETGDQTFQTAAP